MTPKIIRFVLILFPILITIIFLFILPDTIPAHYGMDSEVTRYGSKCELLILPVTIVAFGLLLPLSARKADESNKRIVNITTIACLFLMNVLCCYFLYTSIYRARNLYANIDVFSLTFSVAGILLIIVGGIMPSTSTNSIIGLRNKWSKTSNEVWKKCQKFCGIVLIITGALLLILNVVVLHGVASLLVSLSLLFVSVIISVIRSKQLASASFQN